MDVVLLSRIQYALIITFYWGFRGRVATGTDEY